MELPISEIKKEEKVLADTIALIRNKISSLGGELIERDEKALEFKKFMWDNKSDLDPAELKTMMSDSDLEISLMLKKGEYLQKLYRIQNNPYFGSIIFKDDVEENTIYIGICHVEDNLKFYVHDWRSPICSLFYDYEVGPCQYFAPGGIIKGEITRKRQYTIKDGKLIHIFDNNINIDDELLQEVLANASNDKMKNIVNTIQMEQNKVIRNTSDRNLIVQGIAGSGKTSVALHRIAFLLYQIKNITSNNILIFSPNKVFSEYISNVLPELGEKNTKETTFHAFMDKEIKEFDSVESFTDFIERSYKSKLDDFEFTKYKQSDEIISDIEQYVNDIVSKASFVDDLFDRDYSYTKDELNYMLKTRYSRFGLFDRINFMADKISELSFNGRLNKSSSIKAKLYDILNIEKDMVNIYINFFNSNFSKIKRDISYIRGNKKIINYDDAVLFIYMKTMLFGCNYNTDIKQIVIDEAQDYSLIQFKLIKKIFKNASYTILGDVNQTINPYYKYDTLEVLTNVFEDSKYIELTKTYRSSQEIIEYSNKVLGLNHVTAIRRDVNIPVIELEETDLKTDMESSVNEAMKYGKSIGIITKNDEEAIKIYNTLKDTMDITLIDSSSRTFSRKLVVIPVYMAKGLEFDSVIIYTDKNNKYTDKEKYLYYVAITRCQHKLIVYNQ